MKEGREQLARDQELKSKLADKKRELERLKSSKLKQAQKKDLEDSFMNLMGWSAEPARESKASKVADEIIEAIQADHTVVPDA